CVRQELRPMNRYDLERKTVVITGGAGGIGRAIAQTALFNGARVSLWDRDESGLADAARHLDAARRIALRSVLGEVAPLWKTDVADFRRVIEVNLIGAYLCLRAAVNQMRTQAPTPMRGHIVNVSSIQGKEGMARAGAYSASKAALISLTKTAGKETAKLGIAV